MTGRLCIIAALTALALAALAPLASGARIEVRNLEGDELPNISASGRVTFRSVGLINVEIICDKTLSGRLFRLVEGTLALEGNRAGFINDVRLANCRGDGTAEADLIDLENGIQDLTTRLSWTRVNERRQIELAGLEARLLVSIPGLGTICLDTALIELKSLAGEGGLFRTLELSFVRLLTSRIVRGAFCPRTEEISIIGRLTFTRPVVGIGVRLTV